MKKLNLTCGSCMHLSRERCFEKRCNELGKLPTSSSCSSHKPDAFALVGHEESVPRLAMVAKAIHKMSIPEIQALAAVLHNEKQTRKNGWQFYQRVYLRFTGSSNRNYLGNFAVGYVISADKDYIRVVGDSGKMFFSLVNDKNSDTIFSVERFRSLQSEMTKKKHFVDPESTRAIPRANIQRLDDVLNSDEQVNKKLTKFKTKSDDLVAIIDRMSRGLAPTKKVKTESRKSVGEIVLDWRA